MFRIWKKILRIIAIILPCFLTIFVSQNSYAVSDVTYTIDSSNNGSFHYFCFDDEVSVGVNCSDYNYLKIQFNASYSSFPSNPVILTLNFTGLNNLTSPFSLYPANYIIISLQEFNSLSNLYAISYNSVVQNNYLYQNWSIDLTLTESLGSGEPSGSITLTENGTYDVTSYAEAVVDVPETIVPGDYHDDFTSIRNVIIVSASVILVLYFFYCIYGMIIPITGGKK